jgi:pimeloyl-ACP methyl ester carboxylesterase
MKRELHVERSGDGSAKIFSAGTEPDWAGPVTFLIHGYNIAPQGAAEAYSALFDLMKELHILPAFVESRSWLLYWAGYTSGGLATGKTPIAPFTYAHQIPSACVAAGALKRYLDEKSTSAHINLIAHSLGCRLVLELLQSYATEWNRKPVFENIFLMAPAVPVFLLEHLSRLSRGPSMAKRVVVMCSERDMVLRGLFPLGQTVAREGVLPEAVGTRGNPLGRWTKTESTTNSHSNYFFDGQTAIALARTFGQATASALPRNSLRLALGGRTSRTLPGSALARRRLAK